MGLLRKITNAAQNQTTYRVGLLQAKAYRILKNHTAKKLANVKITSVHWAFLGLLNTEGKQGMRPNDMAKELGVGASFITRLLDDLKKKGWIDKKNDPEDNRASLIFLTPQGKKFIAETEDYLRKETKPLLEGIPVGDLLSYLSVLQKIIENSENS